MTEFTPGPWKVIWHSNARYPFPLSVHTKDDDNWITRDGTISSEANARLIAASPDLLAALELVFKAMDDGWLVRDTSFDHEPDWAIKQMQYVQGLAQARAVIAKAKGV